MGEILDADGDSVTIDVELARADGFLRVIDGSTLEIRESTSRAGVYPIEVLLTDDSDTEETTIYKISFIILESDQDSNDETTSETESEENAENSDQ